MANKSVKINLSELFKKAHALARKNRIAGDSYSVTFGLCLKHILATEGEKITIIETNKQGNITMIKSYIAVTGKKQAKKKINKSCAMVVDYDKMNKSSLSKKGDYYSMLISVMGIVCIYALTMLAIVY